MPRYLLRTPVNEWIPETGAAHSEADEPGNRRCYSEPFAHLLVVFTTAEDDAAYLIAAPAAGSSHNPLAVFVPVEPFDLPNIRLNLRVLKLLNGLCHQPGAKLQIVGFLVSFELIELGLLRRNQQFEHEPAVTRVGVQIVRQALQTSRLPLVRALVPFRVVAHQDLAERGLKGVNMFLEVGAVFEVKFVMSTLLCGASGNVALLRCIA